MAVPAPFFAEIADAPPEAAAVWLKAGDGTRIRAAVLGRGDRGTVLMFPGRTEFVEKYGPAARDLQARGWGCVAVDWRGQGLADRPLADPWTGHVARFADYQQDVAALMDALPALGVGRPLVLLGHSMGGAIGLRAVLRGLPVAAAAFSAPMWGISLGPVLRPAAWALTSVAGPLGLGGRYAPTTRPASYVADTPFADNQLTRDAQMYAWMQGQLRARPELGLGGPSLTWLGEALREARDLRRHPAPDLPCLAALGGQERIVDTGAIRDRVNGWPGARLHLEPDAWHEMMMERPAIRARFFDTLCAFFDDHRRPASRAARGA
jgi:lysophospholipase